MGVRLRRISEKDLPQLFLWRNNPAVFDWCRQPSYLHEAKHKDWYKWQAYDPNTEMFAIIADGVLSGVCGLTSIDWVNHRAEFSLYISPERAGKNYGIRALKELFTTGFNDFNLNMIWGETFENNRAQKIFERIGMHYDGLRREYYFKKGRYINARLYSITRDEFFRSNTNDLTYVPVS